MGAHEDRHKGSVTVAMTTCSDSVQGNLLLLLEMWSRDVALHPGDRGKCTWLTSSAA